MKTVILKFGGSVLIDDSAVKNAAGIIKKEYEKGNSVIAVVSAQGGMTDALLSEARRLSDKPSKRELDVIMSAGELLSSAKLSLALQTAGVKSISLSGFQAGIKTSSANGEARIKEINTDRIKKELVDTIAEQKGCGGDTAIDLIMITKYLERIGDHATNIAEWVEFSITGIHAGNVRI